MCAEHSSICISFTVFPLKWSLHDQLSLRSPSAPQLNWPELLLSAWTFCSVSRLNLIAPNDCESEFGQEELCISERCESGCHSMLIAFLIIFLSLGSIFIVLLLQGWPDTVQKQSKSCHLCLSLIEAFFRSIGFFPADALWALHASLALWGSCNAFQQQF
jgi:hypothetical protein